MICPAPPHYEKGTKVLTFLQKFPRGEKYHPPALSYGAKTMTPSIQAATDTTPIAYLRAMRLEEARRLLHVTDCNISEIAYSVGYRDPNFFTRVFTKEFGVSPKRMREG